VAGAIVIVLILLIFPVLAALGGLAVAGCSASPSTRTARLVTRAANCST
jgi:hypothetical protein